MEVDPRWYDGFFEGDWLDLIALDVEPERTQAQVDFVVERLALAPGARVLDLACGHGRHSLELARRGFSVTGVDLSARSLELAREAAATEGLEVELVHLDLREIDWTEEFDAAINLYTSFGYFEADEEHQRVLDRVGRALRAGGAFLIDTINLVGLVRVFREREWHEVAGGALMLETRSYDLLAGRNLAVWTFVRADGSRSELRHSVRLYTAAELAAMFARAGIPVEAAWGGFDGAELTLDAVRAVLLGRKA